MTRNQHNIITPTVEHSIPFRGQEFQILREACLNRKMLFEDPHFQIDRKYVWKRPYEITNNPSIFVDGASRHDVLQGPLGNCWMLAAMSAIASQDDLIRRVVPEDQSFVDNYAGIFHFRIWQFGNWYDVVIDDRLPVNQAGYPKFVSSKQKNEFWVSLLEKAFVKLVAKKYQDLEGGLVAEALEDFTGGVVESIYMSPTPKDFEWILLDSYMRGSVMCCYMTRENPFYIAFKIHLRHSYTITCVRRFNIVPHGNLTLIRLRNPWGMSEWTGPWSDSSPEWFNVPGNIKQDIGLITENDGEFWMQYEDFTSCFNWTEICHLTPDVFYHHDQQRLNWYPNIFRGSWLMGVSHGGKTCLEMNPQIRLCLRDSDDKDLNGFYTVLIALMQKRDFSQRRNLKHIGVVVYNIENAQYLKRRIDRNFVKRYKPIAEIPSEPSRQVAHRFNLLPGTYCIIPYMEYKREGDYMLRVFTNTISYEIEELGDWSPPGDNNEEEDHSFRDELRKVLYFCPFIPPF